MQLNSTRAAACLLISAAVVFTAFTTLPKKAKLELPPAIKPTVKPKIQAAILLDVSNSMDGLIDQAKAQLWNMVSVMGKAKCDNAVQPDIEIALYEYGRDTNPVSTGYVKQISPFTTDLDKLSKDLFSLTTNGGDEYCGQVIFTSLNELKWDPAPADYKVIFIAGNEDFLQGNLHYTKACALAKSKGVIVNTIYCGDRQNGINEHWNLNAECGSGSFTNINQDEKIDDIPTPYDSVMFALNEKLNNTYIAYGAGGKGKQEMQAEMDTKNYSLNKSAAVNRVAVKGQSNLYKNNSWDLVDAAAASPNEDITKTLDRKVLIDSLQSKTPEELKKIIAVKSKERSAVQKDIAIVNVKRETFIAEAKRKNAENKNVATLETAMEKIIKEQAKRYNMNIQ